MGGCGLDVCGVTGKVGKNEGSLHCTGGGGGGEKKEERWGQREREREMVRSQHNNTKVQIHKMAQNKTVISKSLKS